MAPAVSTFSFSTVVCLIVGLICLVLPTVLFLLFRKRFSLKLVPFMIGIATFIIFALVLEQILHAFVLTEGSPLYASVAFNPVVYMLYGGFAAGIFEETGRFVAFHLIKKKYPDFSTSLSYGLGHGGIEMMLLVGLNYLAMVFISVVGPSVQDLDNTGAIASILATLDQTPFWMFLLAGMERLLALCLHLGLSAMVWYSVAYRECIYLYPAAILMHALCNFPAALMQAGVITSLWVVYGLLIVSAALALVILRFLYRAHQNRLAKVEQFPVI